MPDYRQDPFFREIIHRLNGPLNPDLFEQCVSDLLADEHPGLVPIRGGMDMGMDGAFPQGTESFCPLVATIGKDVIGNLARNLQTYLDNGLPCRSVVVATAQDLSQKRRMNLLVRAEELGFRLVQVHDQLKIGNLLYRNPDWARELLGLTGSPPPLSIFPMRSVLFSDIHPTSRNSELEWLGNEDGDKLLAGQPGVGKTFLFLQLALDGKALFVVSDDLTEIANAIRQQQPRKLIIDDAHLKIDLLDNVRRIRDELGAEYSILASCWPHQTSDIEHSLGISARDTLELQRLTRDDMVAVVQEMGLRGPDEHIAFILNQAEGRPGLAAVLVSAYLGGDWESLNSGDAILKSSLRSLDPDRRHRAKVLLAGFSLGGSSGMNFMVVAKEFGENPVNVSHLISELSSGGIVFFHNQTVSVRPAILREALVRDVFFLPNPFPVDRLISLAPDIDELALTLIGAKLRGGAVPPQLLAGVLERCQSSKPFKMFCLFGESETVWVLENYADWLIDVASIALDKAPAATIPLLLQESKGDRRMLHSHPDHPLRKIADWIKSSRPGGDEVIHRRRALLDSANSWFAQGGEPSIGTQALELALSPEYEEARTDPGVGRTVTFYSGTITLQEMQFLKGWWNEVTELLRLTHIENLEPLQRLVQAWSHPGRYRSTPTKDIDEFMKSFARVMLEDIVSLAGGSQGIALWAYQLAAQLEFDLKLNIDNEFELLFGDSLKSEFDEWRDAENKREKKIRKLAKSWSSRDPHEVATHLLALEEESFSVSVRYPYRVRLLCSEIASAVDDPLEWTRVFYDTGLQGELVAQFLDALAGTNIRRFVGFAREHLKSPAISAQIQAIVLRLADPPEDLLEDVFELITPDFADSLIIPGRISDIVLVKMLQHENLSIAGAVALHEWDSDQHGEFRPELRQMCAVAIAGLDASALSNHHTKYQLERLLKADADMAFEWILQRLSNEEVEFIQLDGLLTTATFALDDGQRERLIAELPKSTLLGQFSAALVGNSIDLYALLLDIDYPVAIHLAPLSRIPSGQWYEMAKLAQTKGYQAREIANVVVFQHGVADASIEAWKKRVEMFDEISADEDAFIREIGKEGKAYSEKQVANSELQNHLEQVYGL